jgi:hypothetical protein
MINHHKNNSGFTLVELLVFIGLFSILLTVLTQMFVTIVETQLDSQATSEVSQDSRYILNRLMYDIHRADSLTSPALGVYASSISLRIGTDTYIYNKTGNNLFLSINGVDSQLNSHDTIVPNVQFQRLGNATNPALIQVNYTVKSTIQKSSGEEIKNVDTVIGLRSN